MNVKKEQLCVGHMLKADFFAQIVKVLSDDNTENGEHLVKSAEYFFDEIYVDTSRTLVINGVDTRVKAEKWVKQPGFAQPINTMLYFIEGYAGCGKSTLVQRMFYQIFNHENYKYGYYNYDIGGINSKQEINKKNKISIDSDNKKIKNMQSEEDQITAVLRFKLRTQICDIISQPSGKVIFENFIELVQDDLTLQHLMIDNIKVYMDFICENIKFAINEQIQGVGNINQLKAKIEIQLRRFGRYDMFCIDYLWRLAQYITDPDKYRKYCYVCYDNLDAIENYSVLKGFHRDLIRFRYNLHRYIEELKDKFEREGNPKHIQHFVIFATYRKITAVRTNIHNDEVIDDFVDDRRYIKYIDVSEQYDFNSIVKNRISHFSSRFNTDRSYSRVNSQLIGNLSLVPKITDLDFVKKRYSGLWNNNFRACSNVIDKVLENNFKELKLCVNLIKQDGHGDYSYYFGASSVFLNLVCKVLNQNGVFDKQHMGFVDLVSDNPNEHCSISRLILTYLSNCDEQKASITDLYDKFGKVFTVEALCKSISGMLSRVPGEIWRRPIYYARNAPNNELDIETELIEQCTAYKKNETGNYVEFCLGECGKTLIDAVIPNFEFYATRVDNQSISLYLINDKNTLKKTLYEVYDRINRCYKYQDEFMKEYMNKYGISKDEYIEEKFHPRTKWGSAQLHIERIIFSHISYFNKCRLYFIEKYKFDARKKDEFNDILLDYIEKYLELYSEKVTKMSDRRMFIYNDLAIKLTNAKNGRDKARYASIAIENDK